MRLITGDCLEVMEQLSDEGVKVDLVLTDPPYGITACKWDNVIPFNEMWECLNKITRENTPICLFGSEPFSSHLKMSNIKNYRYDWIWIKNFKFGHAFSKHQPMRQYELISVFYKKLGNYNPQGLVKIKPKFKKGKNKSGNTLKNSQLDKDHFQEYKNYPSNVLNFDAIICNKIHPSEKPVPLLEYLIKTYTNEGDIVLDFTMGSGSTGVACHNTGRDFIGIELDENYFKIAENRIKESMGQSKLDVFNKNKVEV